MPVQISTLRVDSRDGETLTPGYDNTSFSVKLTKRSLLTIQDSYITYVSFPYLFENDPKIAYLVIRQACEDFVDGENSGTKFDVAATIDMGAAQYGSMVQYEPNDLESVHQSFHKETLGRDMSSLNIHLVDVDGNLLDLHGHPMQIMFKCFNKDMYEHMHNPNKRRRFL